MAPIERDLSAAVSSLRRILWFLVCVQSLVFALVSVDHAVVHLEPNVETVVTIRVTAPPLIETDVDLMFVQDISGSMADDIVVFHSLATALVASLRNVSKSAHTGLATFIEKPLEPQGFGPSATKYLLADGSVRNYVYRLETPLSASVVALESALARLNATSNRDLPEAAFEAISQVLACENVGWRDLARKVVVVTTDAKFHSDVDPMTAEWFQSGSASFPPYDGGCYGRLANFKYTRERNNYPSRRQIADLFTLRNAIPIFAIGHNVDDTSAISEIAFWRDFQENSLGVGSVVPLSNNSDNLIDLVVAALERFNENVALLTVSDALGVVKSVTTVGGGAPRYSGVVVGRTVEFVVTLGSNTSVSDDGFVLLHSPGFGIVNISVSSQPLTTSISSTASLATPSSSLSARVSDSNVVANASTAPTTQPPLGDSALGGIIGGVSSGLLLIGAIAACVVLSRRVPQEAPVDANEAKSVPLTATSSNYGIVPVTSSHYAEHVTLTNSRAGANYDTLDVREVSGE